MLAATLWCYRRIITARRPRLSTASQRSLSLWPLGNILAPDKSMAPKSKQPPLVWIDCEMTGLNPDTEEIIEIFCLITDGDLELLEPQGWGTVVHQSKMRMAMMDDWCTRTHQRSGLTDAVIASTVTPQQAADSLLEYVKKHVPQTRTALLAGNSVHADRSFLAKAPYNKVVEHLHHRLLDVSTIKEAAKRWCPELAYGAPAKQGLHQAKEDIMESIEEARYYKDAIFRRGSNRLGALGDVCSTPSTW